MAEVVISAVVQGTVGQILSSLLHKYDGKEKSNANENLERLEMAQVKLEAALEISDRWLITDTSLLRWRKKLKRASQECDERLHICKQRILEEEEMEQEVRNSSFTKRIAHATNSFIFSAFRWNNDEPSRSIVRRFEWFAEGASEFLRFIEHGGTPRRHMPFDPLTRHLFTGMKLQHKIDRGNKCPLFLLWVPFTTAEQGMEASLIFIQEDGNAPEDSFFLSVMLQISESTDIIGIVIKCLQLFDPVFKSTVDIIRKELTQLPTWDFSWTSCVGSYQKEKWDNLLSFGTQWFRPNPLCCKHHDQHELCRHHGRMVDTSQLPDISLEPVIEVNLQCHILPSEYNKHRNSLSECKTFLEDSPHLKAGLLLMPHGSSKDLQPVISSSATEVINGKEQHYLNKNITLEQLEEIMLPNAIDYFCQNAEEIVYQMLWKSKHGTAYIQVEKAIMNMPSTQITFRGAKKRKLLQRQNHKLGGRAHVIPHFFNLWIAHAPVHLRGSILEWIHKEKGSQLAAAPLDLKL